jgi:hypothetical protein
VQRNLTCSEAAAPVRNQSIHTRWNCLVSLVPPARGEGGAFLVCCLYSVDVMQTAFH